MFWNRREVKESLFAQAMVQPYSPGQAVWTQENYEALARAGYRRSPYVFGCIDRLARGASGIPFVLYEANRGRARKSLANQLQRKGAIARTQLAHKMLGRKDLRELDDHALLRLLAKPNEMYGGARLIESLVAYHAIAGNAYLEGVSGSSGPPVELYSHRPDRTQVVAGDARRLVAGYEYRNAGLLRRIDAANMLHWKTFNPLDDWYGQAPLLAAARSNDINNSAREWNFSLMQNSARPSGLLLVKGVKVPPPSPDPTKKAVNPLQRWTDEMKTWLGERNAGKPGIVVSPGDGSEVTWQQTAFTPLETSWFEGIQLSGREICSVFRVPSILVGDVEAATFANFEEAKKALYTEGIFPLMDGLVADLNMWLTPLFGPDLILGYDTDAVEAIQEDQERLARRVWNAFQRGIITLNEARRQLGYDDAPRPWGDQFYWQIVPKGQANPDGVPADPNADESQGQKDARALVEIMRRNAA